jgi:hypothetical protein
MDDIRVSRILRKILPTISRVTDAVSYGRNSPEKRLIGYARVSTYGQTFDSQLDQLRATGCNSRDIDREQVTGVGRPARAYSHACKLPLATW